MKISKQIQNKWHYHNQIDKVSEFFSSLQHQTAVVAAHSAAMSFPVDGLEASVGG